MDMLATAAESRTAIGDLLDSLDRAASDVGYDFTADLLDLDVATLRARLDGREEMTLTQLRQVCIATGMVLRASATPFEHAF